MHVYGSPLPGSAALLPGGMPDGPRHNSLSGTGFNWRLQPRKTTTHMTMGVGIVLSAIVLSSSTLAVAQDYRGTAEQRASCMPDAFRLCASYIPNATMVEMCLRQQKPVLSEACRSVFEQSDGSAPSGIRNDSSSTN